MDKWEQHFIYCSDTVMADAYQLIKSDILLSFAKYFHIIYLFLPFYCELKIKIMAASFVVLNMQRVFILSSVVSSNKMSYTL